MSKLTVFYLIPPKFFDDLFFRNPIIFSFYPPADYLFDFLGLITPFLNFLALKTCFYT